ncbi:carboxypeptidase regulatory-like domain-containing protein [Marixanthomonas spongiae]|uniref:Fibronectin type-III domain-containing protein n=1 Tax=Marixanthomonas spongiae TaxID=2174845 RepID=A0A2U0I092_9FLAO|nr:carboxypeptidase regulatory-like domain-containing protein [Marixanthomonas spongiae]PVW14517.1 hypothetical protein DDV96_08265 [Marixanthomonas spongiae]
MKTKHYYIFSFLLFIAFLSCNEDTLEIERKGTIIGTVLDKETEEPLENVQITTNPASTTATTDEKGEFTLNNILIDDYSVQAELDGYRTGFEAVNVVEDGISEVVINLEVKDEDNQPPSQPILVFPEDGAEDVELEVQFTWGASDPEDDDIFYTLKLRNGSTSEMQEFEIEKDTFFIVDNLQLATNYFWQVSAKDEDSEAVESAISEFKTLTTPNNPYFFVKKEDNNNVIYSGNADNDTITNTVDQNLFKLTNENTNSFKPKKNNTLQRLAFLRTVGGDTHLFTMNLDGTNVDQITSTVPVAGFRQEQISYTWSDDGAFLYYPYFDKLYRINNDGSNRTLVYSTADGSFISEVEIPEFDTDLLLLKTNDNRGYNVRIFTYRLSANAEETVILENVDGAAGAIDITANADRVLYSQDISGSENSVYRQFTARMFLYDIASGDPAVMIDTDVDPGDNELQCRFSPTEGGVIFTRVGNNFGAVPDIFTKVFGSDINDNKTFTKASMPDWE